MKKLNLMVVAASLSLACGDSTTENNDENHEEVSVEADACEHMLDGPAQAIEAVPVGETAPTLADTHTRYDITIPGGSGIVAVEIAEDREMHFFFDGDVTVTVTDSSDTEIAAEETVDTVSECDEVAEGAAYDLGVGTYTLLLETSGIDVSMVPVPGGDHGHEDE